MGFKGLELLLFVPSHDVGAVFSGREHQLYRASLASVERMTEIKHNGRALCTVHHSEKSFEILENTPHQFIKPPPKTLTGTCFIPFIGKHFKRDGSDGSEGLRARHITHQYFLY